MDNIKDTSNLRNKLKKYFNNNDYINSIKIAEQIVKSYPNDDKNHRYGFDLCNLAYLQQKMSKTIVARKTFEKAIKVFEKPEYNETNLDDILRISGIINAENSIGIFYNRHTSKIQHSIPHFEVALGLARRYFKEDNEKIAMILHNLGCVYFDLGKYDEAIKHHEEALSKTIDKSMDYIDALNFLGYSHDSKGEYSEALEYFNNALTTIKGTFGVNSDEYISNLYSLGNFYLKYDKNNLAIVNYEKVCISINRRLGGKHPYMAEVLTKIAECNLKLKNYSSALKIQKKSLSILAETVGSNHIYYSTNLKRIGDVHYILGEYNKCIKYYEEEKKIKSDVLGLYNDEHIISLLNLINAYIKNGNLDKEKDLAETFYKYIDFDLPKTLYIKGLLVLAKIYIKNDMPDSLRELYKQYQNVGDENFDNFVAMALREKENIIEKETCIVEIIKNENDVIEEFEETTDFIMDGIKDFFDVLKNEINSMSSEDLEDLKDFNTFTSELKSIMEDDSEELDEDDNEDNYL